MSVRNSRPGLDSVQASRQSSSDQLKREEFDERLAMTLTGVQDDVEYRKSAGAQCWDLMVEISDCRASADRTGSQWNPLRLAGAAIPALAAAAGGVLVGHLHGTASTVIGWVALIGGVAGASINAMRPADHYAADQLRAARFRGLYWEVSSYAMTGLADDARQQIAATLKDFSKRIDEISSVHANVTGSAQ
jgi:hypothetical protein